MKLYFIILLLLNFCFGIKNAPFSIACANGDIDGCRTVNKFGLAVKGVQDTQTDIWDRADATPTQQIWIAPDSAQHHYIKSSSTYDSLGGTGAQKIIIKGLTDWDSPEVTEYFDLNGITGDTTSNEYVIIYNMIVDSSGSSDSSNIGIITAMALHDSTIGAQINVNQGYTKMAIYAIPSSERMYLNNIIISINKATGTTVDVSYSLLVNTHPEQVDSDFNKWHTHSIQTDGSTIADMVFNPNIKIEGPAIIKISGFGSAADIEGSASFDAYIIEK